MGTVARRDMYVSLEPHRMAEGLSRKARMVCGASSREENVSRSLHDILHGLTQGIIVPALRILRMSEASISGSSSPTDHKSVTGRGGHRIESSRNFWDSSGLKVDSSSTDVAWCHGGM